MEIFFFAAIVGDGMIGLLSTLTKSFMFFLARVNPKFQNKKSVSQKGTISYVIASLTCIFMDLVHG